MLILSQSVSQSIRHLSATVISVQFIRETFDAQKIGQADREAGICGVYWCFRCCDCGFDNLATIYVTEAAAVCHTSAADNSCIMMTPRTGSARSSAAAPTPTTITPAYAVTTIIIMQRGKNNTKGTGWGGRQIYCKWISNNIMMFKSPSKTLPLRVITSEWIKYQHSLLNINYNILHFLPWLSSHTVENRETVIILCVS